MLPLSLALYWRSKWHSADAPRNQIAAHAIQREAVWVAIDAVAKARGIGAGRAGISSTICHFCDSLAG
jgi:hypothetical protein